MNRFAVPLIVVFSVSMFFTDALIADDAVDFEAIPDFLDLPEDVALGPCSAVDLDGKGRLYLFHRGKRPILCFDAEGNFLKAFGDDLIGKAHGLRIDADDNIWVTDIGNHMVFKFNSQGKLLLALGQSGKAGNGIDRFNQPTDVAFGPKGEFYVSDGYGNNRVVKFAANGKFLTQWGTAGKGKSEFDLPHSILVDAKGRVLVGDRENDRIQIFDSEGKHLAIWPGFAPFGMDFSPQGTLYIADGRANKILEIDGEGEVVRTWGNKGKGPGEYDLPHMLAFDAKGNLYIAEVGGQRFQKLVRKGANDR